MKNIWQKGNLLISPSVTETNFEEGKQSLATEQFLRKHFPHPEKRTSLKVTLFGEPLRILPEFAELFQRDFRIRTKPSVYVSACQTVGKEISHLFQTYPNIEYILG